MVATKKSPKAAKVEEAEVGAVLPQYVHRRLLPFVVVFAVLALVVIVVAVYTAVAKTTITVSLRNEPDQQSVLLTQSDITEKLQVQPITVDVTSTYTYTDFTEKAVTAEGIARGEVTIVNNYSASQQMVATTRLLSESGVLFRTDESVVVGAGESVTVPVYADQPGATGDIGPERFEIVALNATKKASIYAESAQAMTGGQVLSAVVTEADITAAKAAAAAQFSTDVNTKLTEALVQQMPGEVVDGAVVEIQPDLTAYQESAVAVSASAGDSVDALTVTTTATVTYLPVDLAALATVISDTIDAPVSSGDITPAVVAGAGEAGVSLDVSVSQVNNDFLALIDVSQLTNRSRADIESYFRAFPQVLDVEIQFAPFWVNTSNQDVHAIVVQTN